MATVFLRAWVFYRCRMGKEDGKRLQERFGRTSVQHPNAPIYWFHGVSIGESVSYLAILHYFHELFPHAYFLITSGTLGSAVVLEKKLPSRCIHQYLPLDHPAWVKKFLNQWKPKACFWTEADFWPVILDESSQKMPVFLMNGRLSDKSFFFWQKFPKSFRSILDSFIYIFPQTQKDKEKFLYFHATSRIKSCGNLKLAKGLYMPPELLEKGLLAVLEKRPFWIASNTHEGEEEIILEAHKKALKSKPDLLLILIPRHPNRTEKQLIPLVEKFSLSYAVRSLLQPLNHQNVYMADTFGEALSFYDKGHLVFMGGSLLPHIGGHNLMEPIQFNTFVLMGPYRENNQEMGDMVLKEKLGHEIYDVVSLTQAVLKYYNQKLDSKIVRSFLQKNDILNCYIDCIKEGLKKSNV